MALSSINSPPSTIIQHPSRPVKSVPTTLTCGGIHPGRVNAVSVDDVLWVFSSPSITAYIGFAVQAKLVRFESAGASALFSFNPDNKTETQGIIRASSTEVY